MKNYNINAFLDNPKKIKSAYYNLYCPIALQAQTLTSWKNYYFPDFVERNTKDKYTCKNLGFRDSLLVETDTDGTDTTYNEFNKTWESGTRFINNYRPSNSADNLDNSERSKETNYLILPPSSNYFYVPGYFEKDGEIKYGFRYYFDSNSEVAKYGYKWASLTNGGLPRFCGGSGLTDDEADLTTTLHNQFQIHGKTLPYLTSQMKLTPTPQRFPKPIDELVNTENNQLETIVVDSISNSYDDPQEDVAGLQYKFSYDDGNKGYISKDYLKHWVLLLV